MAHAHAHATFVFVLLLSLRVMSSRRLQTHPASWSCSAKKKRQPKRWHRSCRCPEACLHHRRQLIRGIHCRSQLAPSVAGARGIVLPALYLCSAVEGEHAAWGKLDVAQSDEDNLGLSMPAQSRQRRACMRAALKHPQPVSALLPSSSVSHQAPEDG